MSTDVERIIQGLHYVHESFVSLFTFSVALWLLKRQLSGRAIAPIVVSVCKLYSKSSKISMLTGKR